MRYTKIVTQWLKENNVNANTISLCLDDDAEFGTCDITGVKGNVFRCSCLTRDDQEFEFQAGDWIIGDALGKAAGAF